jgi:hypothetical protein
VLGLFLVLLLCEPFIGVLEVVELVLESMESTIECTTDILKPERSFLKVSIFQIQIPTCGASGSSKTLGILPSTF